MARPSVSKRHALGDGGEMSYKRHQSENLCLVFKNKPWQGADPLKAKYIFIGLDANYAPDVEDKVPEIWDYLDNGPGFWRKTGYHHPFRMPQYAGCGDRYHENFAKIQFEKTEADQVSFIELLHVPTTESKLDVSDLDNKHMAWLGNIIEHGEYEYIFIPPSVVNLMRKTGRFKWIRWKPLRVERDLKVLRDKGNGQVIYQMYHFSCYGWQKPILQRQIEQVRNMVDLERNGKNSIS